MPNNWEKVDFTGYLESLEGGNDAEDWKAWKEAMMPNNWEKTEKGYRLNEKWAAAMRDFVNKPIENEGPASKPGAMGINWKDLGRNAEVMFFKVLKLKDDEGEIVKALSEGKGAYVAVDVFSDSQFNLFCANFVQGLKAEGLAIDEDECGLLENGFKEALMDIMPPYAPGALINFEGFPGSIS